jgi:D-alanyl-D-alanine carboxypeptidase
MPKIEGQHSQLFFYILIAGFLLVLVYSIFSYSTQVFAEEEQPNQSLEKVSQIIPVRNSSTTTDIKESLLAKAYVIYDINNKKIIKGQNANLPLPLASLTKIVTVGTLLDTAKKNNIQIRDETKFRIQKALIQSSNEDADSLGYIYNYSFGRDLLTDANNMITNMGINNLTLTNLTGLDNWDGTASNVGTPESIARVFAFMYENYRDVFEYTKFDELDTDGGTITNTNQTTKNTFGIMASKTGFTYEAGGNLGVVVSPEPGQAYVIVVMQSTKEGRFVDMQKIVKNLPLILKNVE